MSCAYQPLLSDEINGDINGRRIMQLMNHAADESCGPFNVGISGPTQRGQPTPAGLTNYLPQRQIIVAGTAVWHEQCLPATSAPLPVPVPTI